MIHTVQATFFNAQPTLLANSFFNSSQLKPRIQMLVNPQTNRRALWRYVLVLPVAALLLMCSQKDPIGQEVERGSRVAANDAVQYKTPLTGEILDVVEQNPAPQGGLAGLGDYIQNNLRYPEPAQRAQVSGKVFVRFVVAADGHITDVQVLKGIGFGCDAEAVRVVKQMPAWIPGRQNGRAVNVRFNLPISFALN